MSSTDDLLADVDRDPTTEQSTERQADQQERRGLRARVESRLRIGAGTGLGARLGRLFSPRTFLVALGLSVVGMALAVFVLFLGGLAPLLGALLAGFLLGLLRERRAYLAVALAGAGTAAVAALTQKLFIAVLGNLGAEIAVVSGGAGLLAAVAGHYFGRDLRDGVTRDL